MALIFRYPAPAGTGTGAVSGGNLVTACGSFDSVSGTASIFGKIYSGAGAPADAKPPPGASQGTCVGNGGANPTWHFNMCSPSLSGCAVGGVHTMRIWVTGSSESCYFIRDCTFTGCVSGSGACVPDCPESGGGGGGGWVPVRACRPVIQKLATRFFVVRPAPGVSDIAQLFGAPEAVVAQWAIQLAYSEAASNLERAVWLSEAAGGERLRLEVTPGSCCCQALLARVRINAKTIETRERWEAGCFDVVTGGDLCRVTDEGPQHEGGVRVRPAEQAVGRPVPQRAQKAAARTRTARRRRTGRGRA